MELWQMNNPSAVQFFDTHTHFDALLDETKESLSQAITLMKQQRVSKLMMASIKQASFIKLQQLAHQSPQALSYGVGLHPLFIEEHQLTDLAILEQHLEIRDPLCVAVAEIGLERAIDELLTEENWRKQCDFLTAQLALAKKFNLPVSLHSRRSNDQLVPFLRTADLSQRGVVHGFSGSYQQAKRLIDLGYYIGVGGTITYPRANKTRRTITRLPLDSLVLETDTPDMPLQGYQGQANRPERVVEIFDILCELRTEVNHETPTVIAETIWNNSCKLFPF